MCIIDNGTHAAAHVTAPFVYDGEIRSRILRLKYANERRLAAELALDVADHVRRKKLTCDVVTWIPTTRKKRNKRGIDQAEMIAMHVARHLRVPCRQLLVRARDVSQTGQTRVVRLAQVRFRARRPQWAKSVLVVDDVVTTGASMRAAHAALLSVGATSVHCVAVAVTPPRLA